MTPLLLQFVAQSLAQLTMPLPDGCTVPPTARAKAALVVYIAGPGQLGSLSDRVGAFADADGRCILQGLSSYAGVAPFFAPVAGSVVHNVGIASSAGTELSFKLYDSKARVWRALGETYSFVEHDGRYTLLAPMRLSVSTVEAVRPQPLPPPLLERKSTTGPAEAPSAPPSAPPATRVSASPSVPPPRPALPFILPPTGTGRRLARLGTPAASAAVGASIGAAIGSSVGAAVGVKAKATAGLTAGLTAVGATIAATAGAVLMKEIGPIG